MSDMIVAQKIPKRQGTDNSPEGYPFKRAYFVNLAERYAIDGRLLGKRIGFCYEDLRLSLDIPSVIKKNGCPELGIPWLLKTYGMDAGNWGKINNYQCLDKPETIHAWLAIVFVECFAKDSAHLLNPSIVQKLAKKIVYSLQIIKPDSIRIPSDEVVNDLCEVKHSVSFKENGRPQAEISITSVIDDGKGMLTLSDIHHALKNINQTVSAPYEMLWNARTNLSHHDMRATVLNCATSIEITLKKKISDYFDANHTPNELQEYVFKKADGYAQLVELSKKLNISLIGLPNVQETVMNPRNRVIHGGYVPSYEEATIAYRDTRGLLQLLNVPLFE